MLLVKGIFVVIICCTIVLCLTIYHHELVTIKPQRTLDFAVYGEENYTDLWFIGKGAKQNMYVKYSIQDNETNNGNPYEMTIYFKEYNPNKDGTLLENTGHELSFILERYSNPAGDIIMRQTKVVNEVAFQYYHRKYTRARHVDGFSDSCTST